MDKPAWKVAYHAWLKRTGHLHGDTAEEAFRVGHEAGESEHDGPAGAHYRMEIFKLRQALKARSSAPLSEAKGPKSSGPFNSFFDMAQGLQEEVGAPEPKAKGPSPNSSPSLPTPLAGNWRFNHGFLCCGTLRIAREDFDTNPSEEFKAELMGWVCATLNAAQEAGALPAPGEALQQARKIIQGVLDRADSLGGYIGQDGQYAKVLMAWLEKWGLDLEKVGPKDTTLDGFAEGENVAHLIREAQKRAAPSHPESDGEKGRAT